jgi:hypothetical protein
MATANRVLDRIIRAYNIGWLRGHYGRPLRLQGQRGRNRNRALFCFAFNSKRSLHANEIIKMALAAAKPETIQFAFQNPSRPSEI